MFLRPLTFSKLLALSVVVTLVLLFLASQRLILDFKPEKPSLSQLELLAKDVRINIAELKIRLPVVAILPETHKHVCSDKGKIPCYMSKEKIYAQEHFTMDAIAITLEKYSSFYDANVEQSIGVPQFCPMLTQEWARRVCTTNHLEESARLQVIRHFYLVKEDFLDSFNNEFIESNGSLGEMVLRISLDGKIPSHYCPPNVSLSPSNLCVAAMRIGNNVLAVWVVTRVDTENSRLNKDAKYIKAFIQYGIQETENFGALNKQLDPALN